MISFSYFAEGMALSSLSKDLKNDQIIKEPMKANDLGNKLLILKGDFFGQDGNLKAGKDVADYIKISNALMQKYLDQNKTSTTKGEALNAYIDEIEDTFSQLGVPGQAELNEYLTLLDQLSSVKDTEIRKLLEETVSALNVIAPNGDRLPNPNFPDARQDIVDKVGDPEYSAVIEKLNKQGGTLEIFSKNTTDMMNAYKLALEKGKEGSNGKEKRAYKKALKDFESGGYVANFNEDLAVLRQALTSKDPQAIESAYNEMERNMDEVNNKMWQYEQELTEAGVWPQFAVYLADSAPANAETGIAGSPTGSRRVVDEWREMGFEFEKLVDNLQRGVDVREEYKKAKLKDVSYLGADYDTFKEMKRAVKDSNEATPSDADDKSKLRDRYKGAKNEQLAYGFHQNLKKEGLIPDKLSKVDMTQIDWTQRNTGIYMIMEAFTGADALQFPSTAKEFRKLFQSNGPLKEYTGSQSFVSINNLYDLLKHIKDNDGEKYFLNQLDATDETDINATDIENARLLLDAKKENGDLLIDDSNILDFLCDFDSDGKITGSGENNKLLAKNRTDTGAVMGNQMRVLFYTGCDWASNTGERTVIGDGEKTAATLRNVVSVVKTYAESDGMQKACDDFLKSPNPTLEEFYLFVKANPQFKGFLIDVVKKRGTAPFEDVGALAKEKHEIATMDGSVDQVYAQKIEEIWGTGAFAEVSKQVDAQTMENVRAGFSKQLFRLASNVMNVITSGDIAPEDRQAMANSLGISSTLFKPKDELDDSYYKDFYKDFFDSLSVNGNFDIEKVVNLLKGGVVDFGKNLGEVLKTMSVGLSFSKVSVDYGDRYQLNASLQLYPPIVSFGGVGATQINRNAEALQDVGNVDAEAVKRWVKSGNVAIKFDTPNPLQWVDVSFSIGQEWDYESGILQQQQVESSIMQTMLGLSGNPIIGYDFMPGAGLDGLWTDNVPQKGSVATSIKGYFEGVHNNITSGQDSADITARKTQLQSTETYLTTELGKAKDALDLMKGDRPEKRKQKDLIRGIEAQLKDTQIQLKKLVDLPAVLKKNQSMYKELANELSQQLDLLISHPNSGRDKLTPIQRQLFVKQYFTEYLKAYTDANTMRRKEELTNGLKMGGWAMTFDIDQMVRDIATFAAAGTAAASVPGGIVGGISGGAKYLVQNVVLGGTIQSYRASYKEDVGVKGNVYDKINRLANDTEIKNSQQLESSLTDKLKVLNIDKPGGITVNSKDPGSILVSGSMAQYLNIHYTEEAMKNFSYTWDAKTGQPILEIGDVGEMGVATVVTRTGPEVHLFLGSTRGVDTVSLSGYHSPDKGIDPMKFGKKSVEIGPDGVTTLKSAVDNPSFFNPDKVLEASESAIVRDAIKAKIDSEKLGDKVAGTLQVRVKAGVTAITSANDLEISWTDGTIDPTTPSNNKVKIDFQWEKDKSGGPYEITLESPVTSELNTHRTTLAGLEHKGGNYNKFKNYMDEAADATSGGEVTNAQDYEAGYRILVEMASSDPILKAYLDEAKTPDQKRLIVNEVKGIFATNPNVHKTGTAEAVVMSRKIRWRELDWPNGEAIKLGTDRNDKKQKLLAEAGLLKPTKSQDKGKEIPYEVNPNLFGFTAFYRGGTRTNDIEDAMKYSMTAIGATRVLGRKGTDKGALDELKKQEEKDAVFKSDGIFFNNLEKHPDDLTQVTKAINKASSVTLDNAQVLQLLKNPTEGVPLADGRKVTMPDLKYVFYLLGECANESFGIELGKVKIDGKQKVSGGAETGKEADYGVKLGDGNVHVAKYEAILSRDQMTGKFVMSTPKERQSSSEQYGGISSSSSSAGAK